MVVINYEYEKLRKRCFHCHYLTYEKFICPLLRKLQNGKTEQLPRSGRVEEKIVESSKPSAGVSKGVSTQLFERPPGFPPRFPCLSKEDNAITVQYSSHAYAMERLARITRVQHSIEDGLTDIVPQNPLITIGVNKGKCHAYGFDEEENRSKRQYTQSSNSFVSTMNQHISPAFEEVQSSIPRPSLFLPVDSNKGFSMRIYPKPLLSGSLPG